MSTSELHRFKAECISGGSIVAVRSAEEALLMQEMGAVGVAPDEIEKMTDQDIASILSAISIHFVVPGEHRDRCDQIYRDIYDSGGPGYLLLSSLKDADPEARYPQLIIIDYAEEVSAAVEKGASIIVCRDANAIQEVQHYLSETGNILPCYCEVYSEYEAEQAMKKGAQGTVMEFLPTKEEMQSVLKNVFQPSNRPSNYNEILIGIIALQGEYLFHEQEAQSWIDKLHIAGRVILVRNPEEMNGLDAVVLVGGWSNLQSRLFAMSGIDEKLKQMKEDGKPILAICAGMILAGMRPGIECDNRNLLELIDVQIDNNQLSGSYDVHILPTGEKVLKTFSDGPIALDLGPNVQPIAQLEDGRVVGAKEDNVFIFSYHVGKSVHLNFLQYCIERKWASLHEDGKSVFNKHQTFNYGKEGRKQLLKVTY